MEFSPIKRNLHINKEVLFSHLKCLNGEYTFLCEWMWCSYSSGCVLFMFLMYLQVWHLSVSHVSFRTNFLPIYYIYAIKKAVFNADHVS